MILLWLVCDFEAAIAQHSPIEQERLTVEIFLQLMACEAVANLQRLTQSQQQASDPDLTQWASGILKLCLPLAHLDKMIEILQAALPADSIVTFYLDSTPQPIAVSLSANALVTDIVGPLTTTLETLVSQQQVARSTAGWA